MSWPMVKLGDCCQVVSGGTPKREISEYWNGNIYWVTPKDLSQLSGIYIDSTPERITELGLKKSSATLLPKQSLLFSSRAPIGHLAITTTEMATNQGFKSLIPNSQADVKYLFYCLKYFKTELENLGNGATFKEVSKKVVENYQIPLPPLPIQKQIAEVLEKADTLRQQCQQMEQELNALAQAVFLEMFGAPTKNAKGFKTSLLGNIAYVQIGPFGTMLHKSDYVTGGIPLINPTHISKSQIIPSYELTITKSKYLELPQYQLKEGDIIMGRRGEMGRCAIVTGKSAGYFCGTGSLFVRPNQQKVRSRFLNDFLSSAPVKRWFEEQSLGATMPNLNKGIVNNLSVPLPDLAEQLKYEHVLSNLSGRLENYRDLKAEIEHNFNSLMQRAFKGELDLTSNA